MTLMTQATQSEILQDEYSFVRLDAAMADDLSVVNAARVSFHKRKEVMDEEDAGVLKFLMKNRHGTPFEHNAFRFHIAAPIFVFREWQRHRIGSFNEWSARYSKLEPHFYVPKEVRSQQGKPGAYTFVPAEAEVANVFTDELQMLGADLFAMYEDFIDQGVAKEQARFFLPNTIYSEMYWTINARSLMNFLSLRNHPTAMYEIRQYAIAVESFFEGHMPVTYQAFVENGRIAP